MSRIVLAFLLLGLAVLLVPSLRERAQPRIDESREWLGQKLEEPLSPVLTPFRTVETTTRIDQAVRLLIRTRNAGSSPPQPDDFTTFLKQYGAEFQDGWGAPLILIQEPDSVIVMSAGLDREYRTSDDLTRKIRYRAPRRFPSRIFRRR
jgi:hypothetical protein